MKDWERKQIEYRPPLEPKRDLLGEGREIAEEVEQQMLDSLPPIMKDAFTYSPSETLGMADEVQKEAEEALNELEKCLANDKRKGVSFEDYKKAKATSEDVITPKEREDVFQYEWNHNLDLDGKPQVGAYARIFDLKKELDYFVEKLNELTNRKPNESVDDIKTKETQEINNIIPRINDGEMKIYDAPVKKIAMKTKISAMIKSRIIDVRAEIEKVLEALQQSGNELTAFDPKGFVQELAKAGKDNVKRIKNLQEKGHVGNAYRNVSANNSIKQNSGVNQYRGLLEEILTANKELEGLNPAIEWIGELDEESFEFGHPLGKLMTDTMDTINVAAMGIENKMKDFYKINQTSSFVGDEFNQKFEEKCRTQFFNDILGNMIEDYDFNNNSEEEANRFVKKFGLDKPRNICG